MKKLVMFFWLALLLTPNSSPADFPYTLAELEEMVDASPQIRLLTAKQEET